MEDDYYSIDAILASNQVSLPLYSPLGALQVRRQKLQCTFKVEIPELGHLDGGTDQDVWHMLFGINVTS